MNLNDLIKETRETRPPRILIHGDGGVGKSSLAAAAPSPIFMNIEDGLSEIDTVALPCPESFDDILAQLRMIYNDKHDYKTLIVDSADWLETLLNADVCKKNTKDSISDFGYGAGYQQVHENFQQIVNALTEINRRKGMVIIVLCHSQVVEYKNPLAENFDCYRLKMRDKNSELFIEFATLVGFLHTKIFLNKEDKGFKQQTKAVGGSQRILDCMPHAAFTAKNRYGITQSIEIPNPKIGWENLIKNIKQEK